jgi:uncharacterized protein YbaR (Trm112 family)
VACPNCKRNRPHDLVADRARQEELVMQSELDWTIDGPVD